MKKNHWGVLLVCMTVFPAIFAYGARADMSLDEFLEYSVRDLQERVRALNATNQEVRQKCDALRRRILSLRQEMRVLDNRKIELMENRRQLADTLRVEKRQTGVAKDQSQQVGTARKNLAVEREGLVQLVAQREQRYQDLMAYAAKLEKDIAAVQRDKGRQPSQQVSAERKQFQERVDKVAATNQDLRQQIRILGAKSSVPRREQVLLTQTRDDLKSRLSQTEDRLSSFLAEEKSLQEQRQNQQIAGRKIEGDARTRLVDLGTCARQLTDAIKETQSQREGILTGSLEQQNAMIKIKGLLYQQAQLLAEEEKKLTETIALRKEFSGIQNMAPRETLADLDAQREQTESVIKDWREKLTRQQERSTQLAQEEREVQKDLKQLGSQKDFSAQGKAADDLLRQRKRDVLQESRSVQQKLAALKGEIRGKNQEIARISQTREQRQKERQSFDQEAEGKRKDLARLEEEEQRLMEQKQQLKGDDRSAIDQAQGGIQDLEFRRAALSNSLAMIRPRYDRQMEALADYEKDHPNWEEYLRDLKSENQILKNKETELSSFLNKVKREAR